MKRYLGMSLSFIAGVVFLVTFSYPAYALEIGARGYYWFPSLKTNLKVDGGTVQGTDINVKDDLGLGYKAYPSVEVFGGLGKHHLSLMYTEANYTGTGSRSTPISFNGTTFAANTLIDSSLNLKVLDLSYQYDIINMENILAGFSIGAIGKIKYLEADTKLSSGSIGTSETIRVPIPMFGIGVHAGLLANILEARANFTGIVYSKNYLYEAAADLSLTPFPFMDIHGGYKIIKLHLDAKDVFFDSEFSGPYVALTIGF